MTDDIVTRLRRDVDAVTYIKGVFPTSMISAEAADEIERLRTEIEHLRMFANEIERAAEIERVRLTSRIIALEMSVHHD